MRILFSIYLLCGFIQTILEGTIEIMFCIISTHQDSPGILAPDPLGQAHHLVGYVRIVMGHLQVPHLHLQLKQAEVSWPGDTGAEAELLHQGHHLLPDTEQMRLRTWYIIVTRNVNKQHL